MASSDTIRSGGTPTEPNPQQDPSPTTIPGGGDDKPRPSTHEVEALGLDQNLEFDDEDDYDLPKPSGGNEFAEKL